MNSAHVKFSRLEADPNRIIIFDSGIGAHSIYQACKQIRPHESYLILEDQSFFPYGEKSEEQLTERLQDIHQKIKALKPKALIIACNTASTYGLEIFRQQNSYPVVGVVPPIKTAAKHSQNILVLATPMTCKSNYTHELIAKYAQNSQVELKSCEKLAEYAELKKTDHSLPQLKQQIMSTLTKVDAIVLGCTHYISLKDEIQAIYPRAQIIDCSSAIAKQFNKVCPRELSSQANLEYTFL